MEQNIIKYKKNNVLTYTNNIRDHLRGIQANIIQKSTNVVKQYVAEIEKNLKALEDLEISQLETSQIVDKSSEIENKRKLIESLKNTKSYKEAEFVIKAIKISKAFVIDVNFDNQKCLLPNPKIKIRMGGIQGRHVTPIAIIERIIKNSLKPNALISEVIKSLQDKIGVFLENTLYENKKNYYNIQPIFEYFKLTENQTSANVNLLIKIIAHFYNKKIIPTLHDSCVPIFYKINTCYLLPPSKKFKKYLYAGDVNGEANLQKGLVRILDEFEEKISRSLMELSFNDSLEKAIIKPLSKIEIKQLCYAVFAMFGFLPLPAEAKHI